MPDMIQRLAQELGLENTGLTLVGKKGQRVQFGCSNRIRHTLSPDNSSITFAGKGDLMNHWLCCITLQIDRDWTWDALEPVSFFITRERAIQAGCRDGKTAGGRHRSAQDDLRSMRSRILTASKTTLIFIDAVEPKKEPKRRPTTRSRSSPT